MLRTLAALAVFPPCRADPCFHPPPQCPTSALRWELLARLPGLTAPPDLFLSLPPAVQCRVCWSRPRGSRTSPRAPSRHGWRQHSQACRCVRAWVCGMTRAMILKLDRTIYLTTLEPGDVVRLFRSRPAREWHVGCICALVPLTRPCLPRAPPRTLPPPLVSSSPQFPTCTPHRSTPPPALTARGPCGLQPGGGGHPGYLQVRQRPHGAGGTSVSHQAAGLGGLGGASASTAMPYTGRWGRAVGPGSGAGRWG